MFDLECMELENRAIQPGAESCWRDRHEAGLRFTVEPVWKAVLAWQTARGGYAAQQPYSPRADT